MRYEISARSSKEGIYYEVTVHEKNGDIKIDCTCVAADIGNMCRHRVAIITGDYKGVIDNDDPDLEDAVKATKLLRESGFQDKYLALAQELDALKKRFKKDEKSIKLKINALVG